jgi:hypothetical protein
MTNLTNTLEELLKMSHKEVMALSEEKRTAYREAVNLDLHNRVQLVINNGFTHIQIGYAGCIKVRKNKNGVFYSTRVGKGSGVDCGQYADLRDCTRSLMGYGWGNNITFK